MPTARGMIDLAEQPATFDLRSVILSVPKDNTLLVTHTDTHPAESSAPPATSNAESHSESNGAARSVTVFFVPYIEVFDVDGGIPIRGFVEPTRFVPRDRSNDRHGCPRRKGSRISSGTVERKEPALRFRTSIGRRIIVLDG